jgi:hypothetical protein
MPVIAFGLFLAPSGSNGAQMFLNAGISKPLIIGPDTIVGRKLIIKYLFWADPKVNRLHKRRLNRGGKIVF